MENKMLEEKMNSFYQQCADHGLKVTPQRVCIYQELLQATDHPSIEEIFQRVRKSLPNISFDTVYRTALSLAETGIIDIIEGHSGSKRFDGNTARHYHFRCLKCHKIIDLESEYYDSVQIPAELQNQFKILNQRIFLEGFCDKCGKA
jgi:Fe2+/Zn2+ uptake regulation proteins